MDDDSLSEGEGELKEVAEQPEVKVQSLLCISIVIKGVKECRVISADEVLLV